MGPGTRLGLCPALDVELTTDQITYFLVTGGVSLASALVAVFLFGWKLSRDENAANKPRLPDAPVSSAPSFHNPDRIEFGHLKNLADNLPVLAWHRSNGGPVDWANRAYKNKAGETSEILPDLFVGQIGEIPEARVSLSGNDPDRPSWFELTAIPLPENGTLYLANPADHLVKAEEALRNFIQTLAQTFAHLPVGLAIFDRDRKLALFNPALSDLTQTDAAWLTARPTLTAFLDTLRENRKIPEPKNYGTWRGKVEALEKAALDGTYQENWPLPAGQTYKVTGRPHPEGAVAFLFEDISASIALQRQFRAETDINQSVMDSLDDAIIVFSGEGNVVAANDAYVRLWDSDPREMLAPATLENAILLWQENDRTCALWQDFRQFLRAQESRAPLRGTVTGPRGTGLDIVAKRLAHRAIMCTFSASPGQIGDPAVNSVRSGQRQLAET